MLIARLECQCCCKKHLAAKEIGHASHIGVELGGEGVREHGNLACKNSRFSRILER